MNVHLKPGNTGIRIDAVNMKLFEAVPKTVLPNIDVKPRAKIPRGPRINWLNRSIALYLHYIGEEFLGFKSPASLSQVLLPSCSITGDRFCANACE